VKGVENIFDDDKYLSSLNLYADELPFKEFFLFIAPFATIEHNNNSAC